MTTLTATAALQAWELAQGEHPVRRSLALLRAAWPEVEARTWSAMPIGARDERLLALHESLFGTELDARVDCPACGDPLQLRFSTADVSAPSAGAEDETAAPAGLSFGGYELEYRLPSSADLLEVVDAGEGEPEAAISRLLERCVLGARRDGALVAVGDLPPAVVDRLQQEMARRDPAADMRVALVCAACGHAFDRRFDIAEYLWDALDDWAQRTFAEVHALASAYGWSEPQILALSAARRRHYLTLVQG